ncbi:MAG: tetratricopeptide repeat protein, partial [Planctomycetota bacterium]|nr:tetratricopeptide repeat protein [Planctomycetota bacterium]
NWHPLTWLSHMLDCQLFGAKPSWHHLTNLLLHITNILLLFTVLRRMTGAIWQSAFVAALFALHPLHVESVAWVAERKDALSTLFWLLTMLAYLGYVRQPKIWRYLLAFSLFALGLMAKPMLVTLPFVLLLLDYWPLERFDYFRWKTLRPLIIEKIPFIILAAISSIITFIVQQKGGAVTDFDSLNLKIRIANAFLSYMRYIAKMVWPTNLAMFYPFSYNPQNTLFLLESILAFVVLAAITVLLIFTGRKYKYAVVGWLWYLGTLFPVIGLIQVGGQAFANRYTYIPLTGLFIILAWGMPDLLQKLHYRKLVIGIAALAAIVALSVRSYIELGFWSDSITLSSRAIEVTEKNYLAHCLLACALYDQGRWQDAMIQNNKSLQIMPGYMYAHQNLGKILAEQNKLEEAIMHFSKVLELKPNLVSAQKNMGKACLGLGRLQEAAEYYDTILSKNPLDADAHEGLGVALGRQKKLDEAIEHFKQAIRIKPDFAGAYYDLGFALAQQSKFNEAVTPLTESLRLDPNSEKTHFCLARVMSEQRNYEQAVLHFREAIRLKPDRAESLNALAWLLAASKQAKFRNPEEAVKLAQKACELTGNKEFNFLDTLAAAYAASGKFPEAVSTAEKVLHLAVESSQNKELLKDFQNRLNLYKAGHTYIEP